MPLHATVQNGIEETIGRGDADIYAGFNKA